MIREIPLSSLGLCSVAEAAVALDAAERTVQKWVLDGLLPVVVAGSGRGSVYLLRAADVKAFDRPHMGRPAKEKTTARKRGKK